MSERESVKITAVYGGMCLFSHKHALKWLNKTMQAWEWSILLYVAYYTEYILCFLIVGSKIK